MAEEKKYLYLPDGYEADGKTVKYSFFDADKVAPISNQGSKVASLSNQGSADIDFGNPTDPVAKNDYIQGADNLTENERETIRKRYLDAEYTPKQDLSQFEALLGKLEGSKMKQADQANRARRGDIYSQGIAQMMRNF